MSKTNKNWTRWTHAFMIASLFYSPVSMAASQIKMERNARSNDVADKYLLDDSGNLFRMVRGKKCQITDGVADFKVSQHKNDAAMIYFVRNGKLVVLNNDKDSLGSDCPKSVKTEVMSCVKLDRKSGKYMYNVVSETQTKIVNTALSCDNEFKAWDDKSVVFSQRGVLDYDMNQCYGKDGANYNSYVAFLLTDNARIIKVKGERPQESKADDNRYVSIKSFVENPREQVCTPLQRRADALPSASDSGSSESGAIL